MNPKLPNNFRDVGLAINELAGETLLKPNQLYRGGEFTDGAFLEQLGIKTVVSFRRRKDPPVDGVTMLNVAPAQVMNNYLYETDVFAEWFERLVVQLMEIEYPVFLHCSAGKDRTGVAVGLLLRLLGVEEKLILEEYLLSVGRTYPESVHKLLSNYEFSGKIQATGNSLVSTFSLPLTVDPTSL